MNKNVIKFWVIAAMLLMTSCLSDVQKEVKKECNLSKIMCGYSGNKTKAEVIMDEIEARIDRTITIIEHVKNGDDYDYMEAITLNTEIQMLIQNPCLTTNDYLSPQMKRIEEKQYQMISTLW